MDAVPAAGTASYAWSLDVLAALQFKKEDLGLVAWTSRAVQGAPRDVFLPLEVGAPMPTGVSSHQLIVIPGLGLTGVFVTVSPATPEPKRVEMPIKLPGGFFPPDVAFTVTIRRPKVPGLYRLSLAATTVDGGSANAEFLFLEPAAR
jgi:hypothetical protein